MAHSRRDFCWAVGALALATAADGPFSLASMANAFSEDIPAKFDVVALDRVRVLAAAQRYLKEPPITITAFTSERSPGGKHDYFSEADYFWPDPKIPTVLTFHEMGSQIQTISWSIAVSCCGSASKPQH